MKRMIAHNPVMTLGLLRWKDVPVEWQADYEEVKRWCVIIKHITRNPLLWLAKPMEPLMKPNVYVKVQYVYDAQQIFDALGRGYRWLCVPKSDLPLALVEERDEPPRDNDLVVLVAPRVEEG